jgi:peptidoglycan/LPS O-acetylase OafA/YrhL
VVNNNKYDFVDALRGWAILAVITYHVNLWLHPSVALLRNVFDHGNRGVQLFFIVSAFTLFLSLHSRRQNEKKHLRNFFIRRLFRIVPLFYAAIIFYFIVYGFSQRPLTASAPGLFDAITTVLFVNGWYPTSINSVVSGGWSIAVEMSFYLLLPLLFLLITDLEKAILATFAAVVLGIVVNSLALPFFEPLFPGNKVLVGWFLYFWFPSQLAVFCLGILFYFIFKKISPGEKKNQLKSYLYLAVAVTWLVLVSMSQNVFLSEHFLFSIGLLVFIYALALYPQILFVNRITTNIGKWSYSMYFVHFVVLDFFQSHFLHFKVFSSATANFFLMLFLVASITVLISAVTYFLIEKPAIRLGQKIIARLEAVQAAKSGVSVSGTGVENG